MKAPRARAVLLAVALAAQAAAAPAEPGSYRLEDYNAPVPETLNGKPALDVAQAQALWAAQVLFVDVAAHAPRPEGLAPGTVFLDKPHVSIKGAVWLPEVGRGALAAPTEAWFRDALAALTDGDLARSVVIFCRRDCWLSWNAARRAQDLGYSHVLWFSQGVEGWREAGLPTEIVTPYAGAMR